MRSSDAETVEHRSTLSLSSERGAKVKEHGDDALRPEKIHAPKEKGDGDVRQGGRAGLLKPPDDEDREPEGAGENKTRGEGSVDGALPAPAQAPGESPCVIHDGRQLEEQGPGGFKRSLKRSHSAPRL